MLLFVFFKCRINSLRFVSSAEERQKIVNELSNPEFVTLLEKQHLKECEEHDYFILERLIQSRNSVDESYETFEVSKHFSISFH
jgi:hypothetical protein